MLQVTPQMRVLVAVASVDFRRGIDGLAQVVREQMSACRTEYYVDGVGLIRAEWHFNKNDRDPHGIDESTSGTLKLTHVDAGPFIELTTEQEPNDSADRAGAGG